MSLQIRKNVHFLSASLLLLSQAAGASAWESEGKAALGGRFSDNPTLLPDSRNPDSTMSTVGSLTMSFVRLFDNNQISIEPRVTRNYFPDRDFKNAEHTNLYLDTSGSIRRERSSYSLSMNASDQGILASEQDDSGNFASVDDTRQQWSISPSATWNLSRLDQLTVGGAYTDTNFKKDFTGRSDFNLASVRLGYLRQINERNSIGVTGLYSDYTSERLFRGSIPTLECNEIPPPDDIADCDPDNVVIVGVPVDGRFENDTTGYSFTVNYEHRWSETTRLSLDYGENSSDLDSTTTFFLDNGDPPIETSNTSDSTQYGIGIVNETEDGSWRLRASRKVVPSSDGTPQDRDQISVRLVRRLTPNLTGNFYLTGSKQESIGNIASAVRGETSIYRGEIELVWKLTRKLGIVNKYIYRYRDRDFDDSGKATANELTFGLTYSFDM
jgi:hypothetical protein